jgi:hypothetical protein
MHYRLRSISILAALAFCWCAFASIGAESVQKPDDSAASSARFANPPAESRILKIIHPWPDDSNAQTNLIRSLQKSGFGGVVCNISFEEYLASEKKWTAFRNAVQTARQSGMALWLYDERGYPSGNAGGLVLKNHPEWQARGLLIADKKVKDGPISLELPPGDLILAVALPITNGIACFTGMRDLSGAIQNGQLKWEVPGGMWHVMAITESPLFEGTHAALNLADKMPFINMLQSEPTARFLEVTHQRYANHLGDNLGQFFISTFTDEPSLMSLFLRPMPYRVLPWAPNLKEAFQKRTGKSLQTTLPSLIAETGGAGRETRYVFWQTVGDLVSENFFGQIQNWCAKHQVLSGGHLLMEEDIAAHAGLYGNFFQCLRRLDAPSIDCLTSLPQDVPWQIARLAASAAALEGKTVVMCETSDHGQVYRPKGDNRPKRTVTEAEILGTINRLVVSGINVITSYYSFGGLNDDALSRLNLYTGRICSFLKGGTQVADIALVYPAESLWTRHVPARFGSSDSPSIGEIEQAFRSASDTLFTSGREFTYIDSRALAEARLENGVLVHGKLRWRAVVLPCVDTLPMAAWEKLEQFAQQGGTVIALGCLPQNNEKAFPSKDVLAMAGRLFGTGAAMPLMTTNAAGGVGAYLPSSLMRSLSSIINGLFESDAATGNSPLRASHRSIDGQEIYFIVNDSAGPWKGPLSLCVEGAGESWNPLTGENVQIASGSDMPIQLEPYAGLLFRFSKARTPRRLPPKPGLIPSIASRNLPFVKPSLVGGEFVQTELKSADAPSPSWTARGTIKKSNVDTFQFATFTYLTPLNLAKDDSIAFRISVPEGQSCAARLLVILREDQGGDFLASTSRSLSADGRDTLTIPFNQFQLAGWSSDKDGQLDLARIKEIRIGWGGYFGKEKETVEFDFDTPSITTLSWDAPGQ